MMKEWQLLPATACHDKCEYVNHRWCTCHVCTPHPLIAGHLYVPTELVCSSDRHVGSVFSICSSTYMAGVFFYVPATKIHQVSTMFLLWPHIWQMSHFAIFQQQTHEICLYCPSLHLDNVFLNSAVATSSSSRIDACQTRKFKAGYTWCTLVLYYWTIQ